MQAVGRYAPSRTPAEDLSATIGNYLGYLADYRRLSPGTLHEYGKDLRGWAAWLRREFSHTPDIRELTREMALSYALSLHEKAPRTVRRRLSTVRGLYRYLQQLGQVGSNPFEGIPLPKQRPRIPRTIPAGDLEAIEQTADLAWEKCALSLLCGAGLRRAELAALRLVDLDWEDRSIRVRGKGNRERIVPMSSAVQGAILAYLPLRQPTDGVPNLLINAWGTAVTGDRLCQVLKVLAVRAGLDPAGVSPHRCRHTFATNLVQRGVDLPTIQELLGHTDLSTTGIYLHSDLTRKRTAVETLGTRPPPWEIKGHL